MGLFGLRRRMDFTVSETRWEVRSVRCEHCGERFIYDLKRKGFGQQTSSLIVSYAAASEEAHEDARAELQRQMRNGFDRVPCPGCGLYQRYMVADYRRRFWHLLRVPGWLAILVGAGCLGLLWVRPAYPERVVVAAAALGFTGGALLGARWLIARCLDPNRGDREPFKAAARRRAYRPEDTAALLAYRRRDQTQQQLEVEEYADRRAAFWWTLLACLPLAGSVLALEIAVAQTQLATASTAWPKARGTIVSTSKIVARQGRRRFQTATDIVYNYTVDGTEYRSDRVAFGIAPDAAATYHEGMEVFVHYNPANPALAVLRPGFHRPDDYVFFAPPVCIAGIALVFGWRAGRRYRRARDAASVLRANAPKQTWRETPAPKPVRPTRIPGWR